uniref:proteasome endopeptidase complex n=1 Tax=Meloidogyne incognita TaxID=6306 RepID=A0A914M5B9_MELIC
MYYRDIRVDECNDDWKKLANMDDTKQEFIYPPLGIKPKVFVNHHFGPNSKLPMAQFNKGTTTLAFHYKPKTPNDKGGVVISVDSRASGGSFIMCKDVNKILPINERMVATMAGGAADCQYWISVVTRYCNLFELREGRPITVSATSKYLANIMYSNKNNGLNLGSMVAGYDHKGPSIYLVDNDGMRCKVPDFVSVGSGSLNAYAVLDSRYKEEMTDEEAIKLGREAIMHATYRDSGSGGSNQVLLITKEGKTKFPLMDVSDMYYDFAKSKGIDIYKLMDKMN